MVLSDFKYLFTIIGGGWSSIHEFWGITKDNRVFFSHNTDSLEISNLEYKFTLDENLDFEKHTNNVGFDSPICTMYKIHNGDVELVYSVGMYNNTPAVDIIRSVGYSLDKEEVFNQQKDNKVCEEEFIIGEIKGSEVKTTLAKYLSTGHKCMTTFHGE